MNKNTFSDWQDKREERRVELIRSYLSYTKSSRIKFDHVTDLAGAIAEYITEKDGVKCVKSTLLRNKTYRSYLISYMVEGRGDGVKNLKQNNLSDVALEKLTFAAKLTISNQTKEIDRLKLYIKSLEDNKSDSSSFKSISGSGSIKTETIEINYKNEFNDACRLVRKLISHYEGLVLIDNERMLILDATNVVPEILIDHSISLPYFMWCKKISSLG